MIEDLCLCIECKLREVIGAEAGKPQPIALDEVIQALGNIFSEALAELPHTEAMLAVAALPRAITKWRDHNAGGAGPSGHPTGVLS